MADLFVPLKPVSPGRRIVLGILGFVVVVAVWWALTASGLVKPLFLAGPWATLQAGYALFFQFGFLNDVLVTVGRVLGGVLIASAVAVPLGIVMGAFKPVEALLEPLISFARYLPASAFIPLLILWAGVGELQKLLVIFIGSVFQIILMIAVTVGTTRRDLVEAAYTLGASDRGIIRRVLLP